MQFNNLCAIIIVTLLSGCSSRRECLIFQKNIHCTSEMHWIEGELGPSRKVLLDIDAVHQICKSEHQATGPASDLPMMAFTQWISYRQDGERFFLVRPYEVSGAVGYASWSNRTGLTAESILINQEINKLLIEIIEPQAENLDRPISDEVKSQP